MAKSKNRSRSPPPTFVLPGQGGPIQEPNKNDVLCGRGGRINSHEGNVQFRDIVSGLKHTYLAKTTKKLDKAHIAAEIVNRIRSMDPPGRFLKESDTGLWLDIGDERARKKAGQALREDAPEIRNELDGDPKDDDDDDADVAANGDSKSDAMSTDEGAKEKSPAKAPAPDAKPPSSSDPQPPPKTQNKKSSSDGAAAAAAAVAAVAAKVAGSKEPGGEDPMMAKKPPPNNNLAEAAAQPSRHTPSPRPGGNTSGAETPVAMNTSSSKQPSTGANATSANAAMPPPLPVPTGMPPSATPPALPMMPMPPHGAQPPPYPPAVHPMAPPGYPHGGVPGYPPPPSTHGPSGTPVPMMAGTPPPVGYPPQQPHPQQQAMFPSPMVAGPSPPPHMAPSPPPHMPPQQQPQQQQQQQQQPTQQQQPPLGPHHPMAGTPFGDPPSLHSSMTSVGVPSTVQANLRSSVASSVTFNTTSTSGHSSMPNMQQQMQQYHFNNGGAPFGHGIANGFGNQPGMQQQQFNMMQQQQFMGRPQHLNDDEDEESEPTAEDFAALMGGNADMDENKFRDEDMFSGVSSRRRHKNNGGRFQKGGGFDTRGRLGGSGSSAVTPDEVPSAQATIDLTEDDDDDEQDERATNQLETIARLGQRNSDDGSTRKYVGSTDGSGGTNDGPNSASTTRRASNVSQRGMWQLERKSRPKERKSAAARFPLAGMPTSLGGGAFGSGLGNGMGQMQGNPAFFQQQHHHLQQQQQQQQSLEQRHHSQQQQQQHRNSGGFDLNIPNNPSGELRASGVSGASGVSDLTVSFVSNGTGETSTFGGMTAALSFGGTNSVNNTQTSATFPNISLRSNEFMSLGEASFNALLEEEHDNGEIPSIDGVDGVVGGALAPPVERSSTSSATSSLAPSVATSSENHRQARKSSTSSGGSRNNSRIVVAPDPSLLAAAVAAEGNQPRRRLSAGSIAGSIAGMSIDSKMSTESSWLRQYSTMQGVTDAAVWNDESGRSVMSDLSTDVLALDLADAATHMSRANA